MRKSLRSNLNQIRSWVRQGRTDAWIAHQLEVTVAQIEKFKRDYGLTAGDNEKELARPGADFDDEIDLRAADEELIAAELEAEAASAEAAAAEEDSAAAEEGEPARRSRRRRTRRSTRRTPSATFEGTFDHGEEGYGLWLDPAVADNELYKSSWADQRSIEVEITEDQIVIRKA